MDILIEIAKNMIDKNIDIDIILSSTGLTKEEIENLKQFSIFYIIILLKIKLLYVIILKQINYLFERV